MKERQEIAKWLHDRILEEGYLLQSTAADEITEKFGEEYTYPGESGNPRIDPKILAEFRKLKGDKIVWEPEDSSWRVTTELDKEGARILRELAPAVDLPKADLPEFEQFDVPFEPITFDELEDPFKDEDKK